MKNIIKTIICVFSLVTMSSCTFKSDDDYEELLQDLKNSEKSAETKKESEDNQEEQTQVPPKKTIDYTALNDELASADNSITVKGNIVANPY